MKRCGTDGAPCHKKYYKDDECTCTSECPFQLPETPTEQRSGLVPGYVRDFEKYCSEDHKKAHDIIWGALVDAEAPLTDALGWAMDYFKPQST